MPEWKDISTAPKDGTPIFVWFFEPNQVRVVSFWDKQDKEDFRDVEKFYWYDPEKDCFWNKKHAYKWIPITTPSIQTPF